MQAEFSEFSFGFALTESITGRWRWFIWRAPDFPSLVEEGRVAGYDVKIDFPAAALFLQFKLSEHIRSRQAREWSFFEAPYYRFSIRRRKQSTQHELLVDLAAEGQCVYYAAPAFWKTSDFNRCYFDRSVLSQTIFVSPWEIGALADDDAHTVSFESASVSSALYCSNPRRISVVAGNQLRQTILHLAEQQNLFSYRANDLTGRLHNQMIRVLNKNAIAIDDRLRERTLPNAALIARLHFGAELLVLRLSELR